MAWVIPAEAVAGRVRATNEIVLKVVDRSGEAQDTAVALDGVATVQPQRKHTRGREIPLATGRR